MENDIVRRAYLKVTGSKGLIGSLSRFGTRKNWVVLRQDSHSAKARVEIFRGEDDAAKRHPIKIIGIDQISYINTVPEKKEIVLSIGHEQMTFSCSSRADVDDWMRDIGSLRKNGQQGICNKRPPDDLGAQFPEEECFRVKLRPSSSLLFHGPCLLEVQRDFERNLFHLSLFSDDDARRSIVRWQIDHIRQYGSNEVAFKFQSGSKSPTGVDWFILETNAAFAPRIHRAVDFWARHIVEQASNLPSARPTLPAIPPPTQPRQRNNNMDLHSPPLPSPPGQQQQYEPLRPSMPVPPAVYEDLNHIPVPGNRHSVPPGTSSSLPSDGAYQAIIRNTPTPDTTYAGLNDITRERSISVSATASRQDQEQYMQLNQATRNTKDSLYMGIGRTH